MSLTKQDIDALVDGMERNGSGVGIFVHDGPVTTAVPRFGLLRALYLAAGLTAEGERKPERVRCWIYGDSSGKCLTMVEPGCGESRWKFTPGWFVPDGAE